MSIFLAVALLAVTAATAVILRLRFWPQRLARTARPARSGHFHYIVFD